MHVCVSCKHSPFYVTAWPLSYDPYLYYFDQFVPKTWCMCVYVCVHVCVCACVCASVCVTCKHSPLCVSQILLVLSLDAVITRVPCTVQIKMHIEMQWEWSLANWDAVSDQSRALHSANWEARSADIGYKHKCSTWLVLSCDFALCQKVCHAQCKSHKRCQDPAFCQTVCRAQS